jgi:phospholipase C
MSKRLAITAFAAITIVAAVVACGGGQTAVPGVSGASRLRMHAHGYASGIPSGSINHVIIIVQENRTPDYLFQGLAGADIASYGLDYEGQMVPLRPESLAADFDPAHGHKNFLMDYNNGQMNGWNQGLKGKNKFAPFGYAPASEVAPYHAMASQYAFADRMFQSNEGSSFPAHLYLVSGSAAATPPPFLVEEDPRLPDGQTVGGGCDAPAGAYVNTINPVNASPGPTPFPCFDPLVLTDLLDAKYVTWRYYQNNSGAGLWQAFDAVRHVRYGADYANVVWPQTKVLKDIAKNRLPNVSWVIPNSLWSDHAGSHSTEGPSWVAAIVNAIGKSQYWNSCAIFVLWDDWGGWYDHVPPPIDNAYELGFRVPLIIISPYAKSAYVSKVQHEFGSILAFTEETFGIPKGSLGTTDVRADDLSDSFDFLQSPRPFTPISAPPFSPGPNYRAHSHEEDP